eukprot:CAMPEP_0178636114 /NCGR_PEP_ID=MMETSP0698-20121128/13555_1 /TAXON_ID=265572 /ORGANISM="Extubocellulus spinifer, Strain CCMP396" /LENGTH=398 /DNA_ID=CAMNT_0020275955 /DNA_START=309 /DNA_END=1502 /DNA_ORIENTATION=+
MPPLLTYAARIADGLPLVASFAPTGASSGEVSELHKREAKEILRGLSGNRATMRMSIETSQHKVFHYLIKDLICYLTLTEQSYPKRLAFVYLEEISDAFLEELTRDYGDDGGPPPPPPSSSSSRTKKSVKQAQQQQQRHVITVTPTLTLPQLRLDASRLFSVSLDYNVQFLVGYPPKPLENLIGDTGDGDDKLVRDFVGRNESVTVRFVPNPDGNSGVSGSNGTGPKKEKKKKKTAGKAAKEASTDDQSAPARSSSGKKRSRRPAAAAEAGGNSSDEYQYEDEDDDDNGITAASSSYSTTGRRSKRAASAAATAAMPDVIAAQERMMAQNGGGGTKKSKKSATTISGSAASRAAAAEKRAAAAASRRMAAMPGRRLVDGTDVAPTASRSPSAASRKRT